MSDQEREEEQATEPRPSQQAKVWWRRRSRKRDQRGLTLVELMIVVTIIAIIAAVAIAIYQDIVKKSKLAADQGIVSSLRSAVAIYYGKSNGLFPASMLGRGSVSSSRRRCTTARVPPTYDPANGKITFTATIDDCP